jgi:hypothetical protein
MRDLLYLGVAFWIIILNCVCIYSALFPFNNVAASLIKIRFGFAEDSKMPQYLMAIPYAMGAAFTPFIGLLLDRVGKRTYFSNILSLYSLYE